MKIRNSIICIIIGLMIVSGCVSSKSITSFNNKKYFKESPSIVSYQDKYFLRFVYSVETFAYYMACDSKVNSDTLIYYLPGTTSTGDYRGKTQFQEIINANEIEIIKRKNVYWEEPDESLVKMLIEELKDEEVELLPKTETNKVK